MASSLAGKLLVATPLLEDPNFHRTVVLLLAQGEEGAFGIVLNRPMPAISLEEHLPQWVEHVASPVTVFAGGPVEPAMALGLAACRSGEEDDGWTPLLAGVGLVDLTLAPEELSAHIERLRVFTGYAGWGGGQLEGEIAQNAWFVAEPQPDDVFTSDPETLWRRVLARQRGEVKLYGSLPDDPRLN